MSKTLPREFKGIYDEESYRKLQEYTTADSRFGLIESAFSLALLLLFWLLGGFAFLDHGVRFLHWNPILTGLVYLGALLFARMIFSLPFDLYHTFVIEQRFGFNKTSPNLYLADQIKSLLLTLLLGAPVLAAILALFQYAGPHAWFYGWLLVSLFLLGMAWLGPALILPLFNKFQPLEEGSLRKAIFEYAEGVRFPLGDIFVMDGSKRSARSNAFFTGLGRTRKIVLFDTLIGNHTVEELVAVLAHEVGHFKHRHVIRHLAFAILNIGLFFFLASLFVSRPGLHAAFGVREVSVWCGLAFFLVIYTPLSRLTSAAGGLQMRAHEFDADRFAVQTTGSPEPMINALKKLSKSNLSNLAPHWLTVALYHSHPPVLKRIEAIRKV